MRLKPPAGRRGPATPTMLLLGDVAMLALCLTAIFWLLVSPLTPNVNADQLIGLTLAFGLPLGLVGVWLNHWAARDDRRRR